MIIEDPDFRAAFGHSNSEIEPAPKKTKPKLASHQHEANLILTRPELFGLQKPRQEQKS